MKAMKRYDNIPELLDPARNLPCDRQLPQPVAERVQADVIAQMVANGRSVIWAEDVVWDYYKDMNDYARRAAGVQYWMEHFLPLYPYEQWNIYQKIIMERQMKAAAEHGNVINAEKLIVDFIKFAEEVEEEVPK